MLASTDFLNRRELIGTTILALGGCAEQASRAIADEKDGKLRVRKDISKLTNGSDEVKAIKNAVKAMKVRSAKLVTDPLGWTAQAGIHADSCAHANWFFLPWHRAYLLCFENICRQESGDSNFALPYWDWTKNPEIPTLFFETDSPLAHARRDQKKGARVPSEIAGPDVVKKALSPADFTTFASLKSKELTDNAGFGRLESAPHNPVHVWIGGDMGVPDTAALDPIFWLHHANIDRLWTEWVKRHPARTTNEKAWLDKDLDSFFDVKGKKTSMKVRALLRTYPLGYRYDTQPEKELVQAAPSNPIRTTASAQDVYKNEVSVSYKFAETTFEIPVGAALITAIRSVLKPKVQDVNAAVRLLFEGVRVPKDSNVIVHVFVNTTANVKTPPSGANYVGSFSFFTATPGSKTAHVSVKTSFAFDLTDTLRGLKSDYSPDKPVKVSLVAMPLKGKWSDKIIIDSASLAFSSAE